jgi:hypothetical protein
MAELDIALSHALQFVDWGGDANPDFYGTPDDGDLYFARLLGREEWKDATGEEKYAALYEATQHVDRFNYIGDKADPTQYLEFPRGLDTTVPRDIVVAVYEEAYQILCGRDIEEELNEVRVQQRRFGSVHTQYMPGVRPAPNVTAGILSSKAWRLIYPYFRRVDEVHLVRV